MNTKTKILAGVAILILAVVLLTVILRGISSWYDKHEVKFNQVVQIEVQAPITIKSREVEVREIVKVINSIPNPVDLKTDTEKYIYQKFGIEDYKVAIAIARSESGLREGAININTNNTIDVGVFQINSIHFKQAGCSLKEVATMQGNVDCAYSLFKSSGWTIWTTVLNGAFVSKLQ
jgi:membrane-associated HD superfamily phosphohydrolase